MNVVMFMNLMRFHFDCKSGDIKSISLESEEEDDETFDRPAPEFATETSTEVSRQKFHFFTLHILGSF